MRHVKRLLKVPTQSFFLLGPRGTGKTTWINLEMAVGAAVSMIKDQGG